MNSATTTSKIRIVVDGRICRQYQIAQPMTLSEIWHDPRLRALGPSRLAKLGADGVAYVSIAHTSYMRAY